jgi:hypothetical protein
VLEPNTMTERARRVRKGRKEGHTVKVDKIDPKLICRTRIAIASLVRSKPSGAVSMIPDK